MAWITVTPTPEYRKVNGELLNIFIEDIGGVKRVPLSGEPSSHTRLFIIPKNPWSSKKTLEVEESIEEIGSLIMESLTNIGEEIRDQ